MLSKLTPQRAVALLAALGVVSGVLSTYAPLNPDNVLEVALFSGDKAPLYPALYFGLVLCGGLFLWEPKGKVQLAVVFVAILIAWIAAYETAIGVERYLRQYHMANPSGPSAPGAEFPYVLAVAGFLAGIVGSFLTVVGISFASRDFRTCSSWSRTILIGAFAGTLLQIDSGSSSFGLLALFVVWQAAVAASVAYGLVQPKALRASAPTASP